MGGHKVLKGLRTWFVIHFIVDMVFGIPLLILPVTTLTWLGWAKIDPLTSRLVGAALMGIGIESFLGRNASKEVYQAMLNLKLIWSASAIFALTLSLFSEAPTIVWLIWGLFAGFFCVWAFYKRKLHMMTRSGMRVGNNI